MTHTIRMQLLSGDKRSIETLHLVGFPSSRIADAKAALLKARPDADVSRVRFSILPPSFGPHIRQHQPETVIGA